MEQSALLSLISTMPEADGDPFFARRGAYRCIKSPYRQVYGDGLRFASLLENRSIGKGDRIIVCGPSSPLWVSCLIGCLHAGAAIVPLDEGSSPEFSLKVMEKSGAKAAVVHAPLLDAFPAGIAVPFSSLGNELRRFSPSISPGDAGPGDLAEIIFTSGTTSEPKGVMLTHGNISANFNAFGEVLGSFRPWMRRLGIRRFLGLLPLSHMFGQVLQVFIPLMMGEDVVFLENPSTASIVDSAKLDGAGMMVATPRFLSFLRDYVVRTMRERGKEESFRRRFERCPRMHWTRRILLFLDVHRLFSLKLWVFLVGGARLEPDLEEFWRRLGFSVWQGYGLTEAAPIITFNNPFKGVVGSIGRVVGEQEFRLAEDGEILVRGPNVMPGYFEAAAQDGCKIEDGWLRTGDLGRRDATGNIFFAGRKKDLIVLADGRNVRPGDVERVLRETAAVRDAVVFGIEKQGKTAVHAVLLMDEGADAARAVRDANGRLEAHQRIAGFTAWTGGDFPRTPTGKVRRGEVLKLIEGAAQRPTGSVGQPSRLREALARLGVKSAGDAPAGARLGVEIGLSSLDRVELASILEEEFQTEIADDLLEGELSLGALEKRLAAAPAEPEGIPLHRYTRSLPFRLFREVFRTTLLAFIIRSFCRLTVRGLENLDGVEPPLIFIANHTSHLDAPVVSLSLPRRFACRLAPAMSTEQFPLYFDRESRPSLGKLLQGLGYHSLIIPFNAYPMPPRGSARRSLKYTGELLDAGWCPLIFPEGSRSPDGKIQSFRSGIGLAALEMGASIVPINIEGLFRVLPRGALWPKRGAVRVAIGRPALFSSGVRERIAGELENKVRGLARDSA